MQYYDFEKYILDGGLDSYNRAVEIGLSLNDNYQIIKNDLISDIEKRNKNFNLEKLSKYLSEFVEKSKYDKFYNDKKEILDNMVIKFRKALNYYIELTPKLIDDFYGYSIGNMEIKLLNFSAGSYGETIDNKIFYVASARGKIING